MSLKLSNVSARSFSVKGGNFPTDDYIAQGFCHFSEFEYRFFPEGSNVEDYLNDQVAVVVMSHVHYRAGVLRDMKKITEKVHQHGAEIIWDLAHSAGALEVDLAGNHVNFAVGCTYKYLNGGPGSPGFLYVSKKMQDKGWLHAFIPQLRRCVASSTSFL